MRRTASGPVKGFSLAERLGFAQQAQTEVLIAPRCEGRTGCVSAASALGALRVGSQQLFGETQHPHWPQAATSLRAADPVLCAHFSGWALCLLGISAGCRLGQHERAEVQKRDRFQAVLFGSVAGDLTMKHLVSV